MCWFSWMERSGPMDISRWFISWRWKKWSICALHTLTFNFTLAARIKAVGISVWIEIHLHTCVMGEWVVRVRGPTVRTRRIVDTVSGLLLRFQNCHDRPRTAPILLSPISGKWHHLIQAERRRWLQTWNSFLEPVVKECGAKESLLKGWALFWMRVSAFLRALGVWANGLSTAEVYKNCQQARMVASLMFEQTMKEQMLGSQSAWRHTSQFLNTTILSKITNEVTMLWGSFVGGKG